MNFRRKAHPIPLPERQFDIAQLGILQHGIQIGQGNFRPILLRGGEVKAHCRPGATQPGSFKHGPVPKPNLRHPTTHVLLIVEQEAELLQIAIRPSASSLAWTSGARVKLRARVSRAALKSVRLSEPESATCWKRPVTQVRLPADWVAPRMLECTPRKPKTRKATPAQDETGAIAHVPTPGLQSHKQLAAGNPNHRGASSHGKFFSACSRGQGAHEPQKATQGGQEMPPGRNDSQHGLRCSGY